MVAFCVTWKSLYYMTGTSFFTISKKNIIRKLFACTSYMRWYKTEIIHLYLIKKICIYFQKKKKKQWLIPEVVYANICREDILNLSQCEVGISNEATRKWKMNRYPYYTLGLLHESSTPTPRSQLCHRDLCTVHIHYGLMLEPFWSVAGFM